MAHTKAVRLFLPGVFLVVLGTGNILVGSSKIQQYDSVVQELSALESTPVVASSSALRRLELAKSGIDRRELRLSRARAKRELYSLPLHGGKIILITGLCLLLLSVIFRLRSDSESGRPVLDHPSFRG